MIIHPEARTTPKTRAEIEASTDMSQRTLAEKYNVSEQTIRKWQNVMKQPIKATAQITYKPHSQTFRPLQEKVVVELRKTLFLPLDDLLVVTREFINVMLMISHYLSVGSFLGKSAYFCVN